MRSGGDVPGATAGEGGLLGAAWEDCGATAGGVLGWLVVGSAVGPGVGGGAARAGTARPSSPATMIRIIATSVFVAP